MRTNNYLILILFASLTFISVGFIGLGFEENYLLVFPSFTDTTASENWRSWVCITNPWNNVASATIYINNQNGEGIGEQSTTLMPGASYFVRPRNIVGYDCSGSAAVLSDTPIVGILEKTRNNNQMTNAYTGIFFDLRPPAESTITT